MARIDELLFDTDESTPADDPRLLELEVLSELVVAYEKDNYPISLSSINSESDEKSLNAQRALTRVQTLSSLEEHEWTDEEIDDLIVSSRLKNNKE